MKPHLIILSDLWGFKGTSRIKQHQEALDDKYSITLFDSQELAGIDSELEEEKVIHQQFVNGGIDRAVEKLLQKQYEDVSCIGFSVGGLIAWKAALQGMKIKQLIAISSTRLRYETEKPPCDIRLFFGDQDSYRPTEQWSEALGLNYQLIEGGHEIYKQSHLIQELIKGL